MRANIEAESEAIRCRVRQLLHFGLAPLAEDIADVRVLVETIDDPVGRRFTRCRAGVELRTGKEVSVEEIQADLEFAVRRALGRIVRAVRRRLTARSWASRV